MVELTPEVQQQPHNGYGYRQEDIIDKEKRRKFDRWDISFMRLTFRHPSWMLHQRHEQKAVAEAGPSFLTAVYESETPREHIVSLEPYQAVSCDGEAKTSTAELDATFEIKSYDILPSGRSEIPIEGVRFTKVENANSQMPGGMYRVENLLPGREYELKGAIKYPSALEDEMSKEIFFITPDGNLLVHLIPIYKLSLHWWHTVTRMLPSCNAGGLTQYSMEYEYFPIPEPSSSLAQTLYLTLISNRMLPLSLTIKLRYSVVKQPTISERFEPTIDMKRFLPQPTF
ncbi:unnamed protein product [Dibothriocephalus latus]|uniref:Uncharacterized protein n=1 Tax=Dibothriocephalus latus TaxID=60516 RepID=A0A3P7LR37_DIBLA|nr:unnamed protein product [Dibothriocephalus latus]